MNVFGFAGMPKLNTETRRYRISFECTGILSTGSTSGWISL